MENLKTVNVYVSAASSEIDRAEHFVAEVRKIREPVALAVPYDWVPEVRKAPVPESSLSSELRLKAAEFDVEGVMKCGIFVLLAPVRGSFGAGFEFALACTRPDVVIVTSGIGSIFTEYTDARFASDEATLTAIPHLAALQVNAGPEWYKARVAKRRAHLLGAR